MCAELWELTEKAALRSADMHGTGPVMLRQTGCQRHRLASESDLLQTGLRVKHKTKLRFAGNVERAEMFRTCSSQACTCCDSQQALLVVQSMSRKLMHALPCVCTGFWHSRRADSEVAPFCCDLPGAPCCNLRSFCW
jgi:hypothetical protein